MVFLPVTGGAFSRLFIWFGRNAKTIWSLLIGVLALLFTFNLPFLNQLALTFPNPIAILFKGIIALVVFLLVVRYSNKILTPVVAWTRKNAERRAEKDKEQALILSTGGHFDAKKVPGITGLYVRFLKLLAGNPIGNIITLTSIVVLCFIIASTFATSNRGVEFFVEEEPDLAVLFVSARGKHFSK